MIGQCPREKSPKKRTSMFKQPSEGVGPQGAGARYRRTLLRLRQHQRSPFRNLSVGLVAALVLSNGTELSAQDEPNTTAAYSDNGRYFTADGMPTYYIEADGTVDWLTFSGNWAFLQSNCQVCHGLWGNGTSFAPSLTNAALTMTYNDFRNVVVAGRKGQIGVMPQYGDNPNVTCYIDGIYVYFKARGKGEIASGLLSKAQPQSDAIAEDKNACRRK